MAAPSSMVRVLARARRFSDPAPTQLHFTQSVVDYLGDGQMNTVDAFFWTEQNPTHVVVSSTPRCPGDQPIRTKRPSFCPIHNLEASRHPDLDPAVYERGVDVGAVVLVESADGEVLIIRRPRHLRTFPNIWVPPGGHMEQGETLNEAGFRELQEETGLLVTDDLLQAPPTTICLWESSFPPKLKAGLPKRHHVVAYIHCKLHLSTASLQARLKPDRDEVGACAWLDRNVVAGIVSVSEESAESGDSVTGSIRAYEVLEDDSLLPIQVPLSTLYSTSDGSAEDKERVSTGTKWALENWLTLAHQPAH